MFFRILGVAGLGVLVMTGACGRSRKAPGSGTGPQGSGIQDGALTQVEGYWSDEVGDAPWRYIALTTTSPGHGRFTGNRSCPTSPCPPPDTGDFELEGNVLRVHCLSLEGQSYTVHIGGNIMEWRQNGVMIRRFKHADPPLPTPEPRRYPAPSAARPAGTPCDQLTAQGCLLSKDCVLEGPAQHTGGGYLCRPASGPCEGGIAQADPGFAADCKARGLTGKAPQVGGGCSVRDASCFCPNASTHVKPEPGSEEAQWSTVSCACGGGPARQCLQGK